MVHGTLCQILEIEVWLVMLNPCICFAICILLLHLDIIGSDFTHDSGSYKIN
jgi:hypothetical protein